MSILSSFSASDFRSYLSSPQVFTLDLSRASLIEIISKYCDVKSLVSPQIARSHRSLVKQLNAIQSQFGCTLMPEQVTDIFWNYFVAFSLNEGHLALSSVKTLCSQLRSILNWASRHNARVSPSYDFVKLPSYSHQQIALTPDEVSHIYHFDLNTIACRSHHRKNLELVKDSFVLACQLGQRHSDFIRLDKTCFDRNIFTILQQKTGSTARVDIEKFALDRNTTYALLEKYNFKCPYLADISSYNKLIHELLRSIGGSFSDMIKREEKVNGVVETSFEPKWSLVSSHTPRRTFITVNILRGFSEAEVRRASGHKSSSAFEKYLCYYD